MRTGGRAHPGLEYLLRLRDLVWFASAFFELVDFVAQWIGAIQKFGPL
jgi:hypothetical protein